MFGTDLQSATAFASALDAEDYDTAGQYLADDCVYEAPEGELVGPDRILASYRANGDSAKERFDSIQYTHQIVPREAGQFEVTYCDILLLSGQVHTFRCQQALQIRDGKIVRIQHREIAGEREQLDQFIQAARAD